jgi:hypothetical protein
MSDQDTTPDDGDPHDHVDVLMRGFAEMLDNITPDGIKAIIVVEQNGHVRTLSDRSWPKIVAGLRQLANSLERRHIDLLNDPVAAATDDETAAWN